MCGRVRFVSLVECKIFDFKLFAKKLVKNSGSRSFSADMHKSAMVMMIIINIIMMTSMVLLGNLELKNMAR